MSRCNFCGARRFWRKETSLMLAVLLVVGVSSRGFCAEDDKNDIDDGCLTRAIQYTMKGDLDSAIAEYGVAIFLNPKCSLAYYNRAKLYEYKGSYEQAVIDYGNAIACDPAYEQAYYYRGIVYQTCGMHELAIADYSKVLEISDNKRIKANAHNNLGLSYQAKGKPDKALVEFGKALDLIPDLVNAHYNRALARIDLQDYTRAILDFLRELELYPQSFPAIHYSRALSNFTSREYAKSWKEVEILEAADEKVSRVFLEDLTKASGMRKPLSAGEKKAVFHFKTANAHFSDLNFSKAVSEYDLAVEADPLLGKAYFFRGMAHFHLQDYRQCQRDVVKAKSLGYEVSDTLLARLNELIKENEKPEAPAE